MATDSMLSIGADLSQLRREIAKIPNLTDKQAQATLIKFEKTLVRAQQAAKKANKSIARSQRATTTETTKTAAAMTTLEDAAGDSDSAIMGLSGGLSLLNPKLGEAAGLAGDFGAGVESVVRILGKGNPWIIAMTVAATAAAAAYALWAEEQEKHKAVVEASTNALKAHQGQLVELRAAQENLAVTLGDMTEAERDLNQMRQEQYTKTLAMTQELTAQISVQGEAVDEARVKYEEWAQGVKDVSAMTEMQRKIERKDLAFFKQRAADAKAAYDVELGKMQQLNAERQKIVDTSGEIVDAYEAERIGASLMADAVAGQAQIDRERAEAEPARARLAAEAAAAQAAASAAEKADRVEMLQLSQAQAEANAQLSAMELENANSYDQAIAKINQRLFERLEKLDEIRESVGESERLEAQFQAAQLQNEQELEAFRIEIHEAHKARQNEMREAQMLATQERIAEIQAERQEWMSMAGDVLGAISDISGTASDTAEANAKEAMERSEDFAEKGQTAQAEAERKKAEGFQANAQKLFKLAQKARVSEVAIAAAAGIAKVWADNPNRPVRNAVLTGVILTTSAAQIGAIRSQAPPTFDIGGVVGSRARDSQPAMLRAGEGVLTAQGVSAVGGAAGVHAANRGAAAGPGVVALPVYNHFGRFFSEELARPGAARRAMISAGARSNLPGRRGY